MYLHNLYHLGTFIHTYTLLKESQWWSKEQIEEYQLQQLKKLLTHAYENVTYYTKLFNKLDLKPEDINSFQDLQKIPYLTKEMVRKNFSALKATNYPEHRFENLSTGGSTGQHFDEGGLGVKVQGGNLILRVAGGLDPLNGWYYNRYKTWYSQGDVFITVTGNKHILRKEHFQKMKDGAIVANSGHFNVEIDIPSIEKLSKSKRKVRSFVEEYLLRNGKKIYLLGEGRLINLASAEGHPAVVMDMSFANQALSVEYLVKNYSDLERDVYPVPEKIDREIAGLKLGTMGIKIDRLSSQQKKYLSSWSEGT